MSCWEVKHYLGQLIDFADDETDIILPLCTTGLKEIEAMLRPDADRDDIRIVAAAAGKAYYKLMIRRSNSFSGDEVTDFKAGDVSISSQKTDILKQLEKAEKYCEKMMAAIVPLCTDNSFAFRQVHIK